MKKVLAVVSDKNEFQSMRKYLDENFEGEKIFIHRSVFLDTGELKKNERVFNAIKVLSEKTQADVEKQAAFFAQNWYKFDKEFEKETTFDEINLGFVYTVEIFQYFKDMFMLLEGINKTVKKEKPVLVVAGKNTLSGETVRAAKRKGFPKIELVELEKKKKTWDFPNLTKKKVRETRKKLKTILKKMLSKEKKDKKKVFIRSRGYLGNLEKELSKNPELDVLSLDEFLLGEILNPLQATNFLLKRKNLKKHIAKIFDKTSSKKSFKKRFVFNGMNFFEVFKVIMPIMHARAWPEFVLLIEFLSNLFEKSKPEALVVWTDMVPFERICVLIARKTGTKSLVVQHAAFRAALKKSKWVTGFAPVEADKISVWGSVFKKSLTEHKVPGKKIVVTGTPKVDILYTKRFEDRKIRKQLGIGKEKIVVLAPQLSFDKKKAFEIAKAVEKIKGAKLVVKTHPADSIETYRKIVGEKGVVVQNISLYDLLHAADAIIIHCSTVGLEAMCLGRPVLFYGGKQLINSFYYDLETGAYPKNKKELEICLEGILNDSKKRKTLLKKTGTIVKRTMFKKDGKSTKRVAKLVYSMT